MNKRRLAQERNFNKMRVMGISINKNALTTSEKEIWTEIEAKLKLLKDNWDAESQAMGFTLLPYKCSWCGKRSSRAYVVAEGDRQVNYCHKHYQQAVRDLW